MSWGGLEMNQIRNASWMRDRGHLVNVLVLSESPAFLEAKKLNLPILIVDKHKRHYDFFAAWKIYKTLKNLKVDCLILRNNFDLSLAATVSFYSRGKIKTLYFMEMQFSFPKKQFFRTWRYKFIDAWCCPLSYLKEQVIENTRMNPSKIHVVPSGIDFAKIQLLDKQKVRGSLDLPDSAFIYGVLGRIDPKKGQKLAVEAFGEISDKNNFLWIMGKQSNTKNLDYQLSLEQSITENNINQNIRLNSFSENISEFFSAIDALVVPSVNETVGMVTIESLAYQIPVIGTNSGGTREIIQDGKNGLLFHPNSVQDLKLKMKEIDLFNQQCDKNRLLESVNRFDKNKTCNLVEEIISEIKNKS
jgi:glycosyltransferase involved in cell wall biosynthesis